MRGAPPVPRRVGEEVVVICVVAMVRGGGEDEEEEEAPKRKIKRSKNHTAVCLRLLILLRLLL